MANDTSKLDQLKNNRDSKNREIEGLKSLISSESDETKKAQLERQLNAAEVDLISIVAEINAEERRVGG